MSEKREKVREAFAEKNRRRREHFDGSASGHKSARLQRRERRGAFGRDGDFDSLAAGTAGRGVPKPALTALRKLMAGAA